ncbi:hypothetical protein [Amycolatopsis minnesotensis]|uniref:Uncharacterized protein n=1 Tax=Amycolatopsis minnesotensis TaxID=337894 RepID=A0ABN2SBN7_9PSEU
MHTTSPAAEVFEVFGDATMIDLPDRYGDVLAEPRAAREVGLLTFSAITIPPSDLPAVELPDYHPTPADLAALAELDDEGIDARVESANTLAAFEGRHRELLRLREKFVLVAGDGEDVVELERAA